jgi:hypothetical protein
MIGLGESGFIRLRRQFAEPSFRADHKLPNNLTFWREKPQGLVRLCVWPIRIWSRQSGPDPRRPGPALELGDYSLLPKCRHFLLNCAECGIGGGVGKIKQIIHHPLHTHNEQRCGANGAATRQHQQREDFDEGSDRVVGEVDGFAPPWT